MSDVPVITLDGPGGAGKGTVGQHVAIELGWHYLDSGALYRVAGWIATQHDLDENQADDVVALLRGAKIRSEPRRDAGALIRVDGYDLSEAIRHPEIADLASRLARLGPIRAVLLTCQRDARQAPGLIADGRDMGTVVFPDADLKIYLTASAEARAQRRYNQLKDKGLDVNLARLIDEMNVRDQRDRERTESPMKPAQDAIRLDTTDLTIAQVVARVLELSGH